MYTFYTDKSEDFKCQLEIEGADLSNVTARLLLKSSDMNLVFEGNVSNDGMCTIPVSKLKNILKEQVVGNAILEVIVDDTYFKPWEDQYTVKTSKKVTAEVLSNSKPILERKLEVKVHTPIVKEEVETVIKPSVPKTKTLTQHAKFLAEILNSRGITINNAFAKKDVIGKAIENYAKKTRLEESLTELIKETLEHIK